MTTASVLAMALLHSSAALADDTTRRASETKRVESNDLLESTVLIWDHLRATLSTSDESVAGQEVAARVLRLTANVAFPGVPLPDIAVVAIPTIETRPVAKAVLTSQFGWRRDPIHGRSKLHAGMDFSADPGTPVVAAGDGVVIKAERMGGYGRIVIIDHGSGFVTRYAHLSKISVKEGERVPAGSRVGAVGSSGRVTGPHLHFEVRVLGQPVNPAPILGIKTRRFGERLRDLLTLPARVAPKKDKSKRRTRRSRRQKS